MSILFVCDHRVLVHRDVQADPASPDQDEYGDPVPNWTAIPVPSGLNATVHRTWPGNMEDRGPGEIQATMRQWFMLPEFDVQERDVLEVAEGPEAGRFYRVESVTAATMPLQVHHYEVMATVARSNILQTVPEAS